MPNIWAKLKSENKIWNHENVVIFLQLGKFSALFSVCLVLPDMLVVALLDQKAYSLLGLEDTQAVGDLPSEINEENRPQNTFLV